MRTNDTRYMQPIMSVIAATDPSVFKAMQEADWPITVVDGPEDLKPVALRAGPLEALSLAGALAKATGVTLLPKEAYAGDPALDVMLGHRPTFLNRPYIARSAEVVGVRPEQFAASTMVHEFQHHNGTQTEPPAYAAAAEFALKMGEPALAQWSLDTKREYELHSHNRYER